MGDSRATTGELANPRTVHARLTVRPTRSCPVTKLASEYGIRGLVPAGEIERAPQAVVETTDPEGLRSLGAHPVLRVGDATVCRLPTLERTDGGTAACGHDTCLAHGYSFLPLAPYHTRWAGGQLQCSFAAIDRDEIQQVIRAFGAADFLVELDQLIPGGEEGFNRPAVIDLDQLTDRQRQVARVAVEQGYFDPDGPSAAELADALDISKATLSEHLGTVEAELLTQAFQD